MKRPTLADALAAAALIVCALVTGCATTEEPPPSPPPAVKERPPAPPKPVIVAPAKPKPVPPPEPVVAEPPKEPPRSLGLDELAKGVKSYEEGDYTAALKQLQAALDLGLTAATDRASAHKHLAFIACSTKRIALCRGEFRKAFADDPAFDLTRAEAGHPVWGPVFRSVKAEIAKAKRKPGPATKSGRPSAIDGTDRIDRRGGSIASTATIATIANNDWIGAGRPPTL